MRVKRVSIELFEHNQKAYEAALTLMDETGRAAVIHPTGTGKSFIGFKLAEQYSDLRICWLSPSEYIYKTQLENLRAAARGYEPGNICFMTYAKLMVTNEAEIEAIQPDYIVLDEFHRCGAAEWGKGVERLFAVYPEVPILGMSATNIRYLDNQRNMADELFDGNIASEMTLGEAIARNILLPPVYIVSLYSYQKDLEKYQRKIRQAKTKIVRDAAQKYLDALRRALTKADGLDVIFDKHIKDRHGKFIVFCANIDHVNEMTEKAAEWFGRIDSSPHIYRVYAEDANADKEFAAFKQDDSDHLKLLFCIDMLNEGVHVEHISGVILLRPTVSPIIYKQQIGRALSATKGREPVIFDVVNNFESLYSIGTIEEEMQEAVTYYNGIGSGESIINSKFHIIDEVKDCRRLFDELQDTLSASWDMMFAAASWYREEYGNLIVPKRYKTIEGYSLGSWVDTQRRVKKGIVPGIMTEERVEKLESIGMVWDNFSDFNFEQNYRYARDYYEKHQNLDVAALYVNSDGFALGQWISNLRSRYKQGNSYLTKERIESLEAIGMIWDKHTHMWESNFAAAQEYRVEYGGLDIEAGDKTENGTALGAWIRNMRRKYENGKLSEYQIEKLNSIDMIWTNTIDNDWQNYYEKAAEYYRKYGNLDVPAAYKVDGAALGKWIRRYRINKTTGATAGKLTDERREKLDAIGMIWNTEDSWNTRYSLLLEYHKVHGNINIPSNYVTEDNIWLGNWLYLQKKIYKGKVKGESLTDEQIGKLEALGINWGDFYEVLFDEYMEAATAYYEEYGHLNVANKFIGANKKRLDSWVRLQRKRRSESKLTGEQIERLSAINMMWETETSWGENER